MASTRRSPKKGFTLLAHDLATPDPARVAEDVLSAIPVELIVNNVGVTSPHRFLDLEPEDRHGRPADLGPMAVMLLSDALSGYVTGANVPVDGGLDLHTWVDD